MIEPTVGRIVHYRDPTMQPSDKPLAAIVTKVHGPRLVNLTVCCSNGDTMGVLCVGLLQDGDVPPEATEYAEWMPYQKGQAAKTEQLEKKLSS